MSMTVKVGVTADESKVAAALVTAPNGSWHTGDPTTCSPGVIMPVLRPLLAAALTALTLASCSESPAPAPATVPSEWRDRLAPSRTPAPPETLVDPFPTAPANAVVFQVTGSGNAETISYGAGALT